MSEPTLRELFDQAHALPADQREAFLRARCSDAALRDQALRLLTAAAKPDARYAARDPARWLKELQGVEEQEPPAIGAMIGPFVIDELLGEGGSAMVYRARRQIAGVEQVVALKVLRHGLAAAAARQQFDRERRMLSRLEHPQIARLIDAGISHRGEAWIALEYVDGLQLLDHVRNTEPGLRERIGLVLRIARVVAAAHRSLVVHRDLKPGNVMVTRDGEIKLLDFGIAKMIEPDTVDSPVTQTQLRAFTPAYAAPEQRDGGVITTATDVYSLGILLEELLGARRRGGSDTAVTGSQRGSTTSRAEVVGRAAALAERIPRGELTTILRKATAEEAEQRYEGASAFADDLQRLLGGLPVRAHPPSQIYRMRKFVARHRGAVVLTTLMTLGVLAALTTALWQTGVARQEATRAQAVTAFMVGLFRAAEDRLPRNLRPTPELLVETAREALASDTSMAASTRAEIALTLAEVSRLGARYREAASLLADARGHLAGLPPSDSRRRRLALAEARVQQDAGQHREALDKLRALRAGAADPLQFRLEALAVEAEAYHSLGEHETALATAASRHALAADALGASHPDALRALLAHGVLLVAAERFREALELLSPALKTWRNAGLVLDRDYMAAANAETGALRGLSLLVDALAHSERLLTLQRGIYSEPHDVIAQTLRSRAQILDSAGRTEESIDTHRASIAMFEKVLGPDHEERVTALTALGVTLAGVHRLEQAEETYLEAVAACERSGVPSVACARARASLGMTYYRQGRLDEAEREISSALARYREVHGEAHLNVASTYSMLSNVAMADERVSASIELSRRALAIMDVIGMQETPEAMLMRNSLATALWLLDDNAEALIEIDRSIEGFDRLQPGRSVRRTMMRVQRAQILLDLDRAADARAAAEEALAIGAPPASLAPMTRELLRHLTARSELFKDLDPPP